jgi:hypothetical protein
MTNHDSTPCKCLLCDGPLPKVDLDRFPFSAFCSTQCEDDYYRRMESTGWTGRRS